ncbi:Dyslexia-associated protein KIAA0319-like protein [Apodemus speciosus]|uniref:Dyslexia-associated protein KIAA0319-like protein n=1 Tax=Apodemus speciosus TaxID=105296 RepID=A0ABQ0EPD9_APOSI
MCCTGSASLEGHGEETGNQAKSRFLGFARMLLADISEASEKPVPALQGLLLQRSVGCNR